MKNQTARVLDHMQRRGSITQAEANAAYGITRLSARIWELRHEGYRIMSSRVSGVNRYGETTYYAKYQLVGGQNG